MSSSVGMMTFPMEKTCSKPASRIALRDFLGLNRHFMVNFSGDGYMIGIYNADFGWGLIGDAGAPN